MQTELSTYIRNDSYKKTMNEKETELQRNIIKNLILSHPEGITDLEICVQTGIPRSSVTGRRNEINGIISVGYAKIVWDGERDRINTLWGYEHR